MLQNSKLSWEMYLDIYPISSPKKHEDVSKHNTRNKDQFIIPRCTRSFVPDAVKHLNSFNAEAGTSQSTSFANT